MSYPASAVPGRRVFMKSCAVAVFGDVTGLSARACASADDLFANGSAMEIARAIAIGSSARPEDVLVAARGFGLAYSLAVPMVELRDRGRVALSMQAYRAWTSLDRMVNLANRGDLSSEAHDTLREYLNGLPGFVWGQDVSEPARGLHLYFLTYLDAGLDRLARDSR